MKMTSSGVRKRLSIVLIALSGLVLSHFSYGAEPGLPTTTPEDIPTTIRIYTLVDFERFTPRNALDMLNRVPGFAVMGGNQGRGLGQASTNVLINGQRISSKSQNIFDQLRRVTVENVEHIEIVDGATLDLPGLSGQVANVVTRGGAISGRYEWRTVHRPKYAEPGWWGGEFSVNGSTSNLEWNAAYTHDSGRGGAGGWGFISDNTDTITEWRDVHIQYVGEFPSLSGSLNWTGSNNQIANLNVQYTNYNDEFSNDEKRIPLNGVGSFRDFDNSGRSYGYEVGGDYEFMFGPGTLKLIGLESFVDRNFGQISRLIFEDDSPTTGNRFLGESESVERILRSEYRWDMLGGNWEVDLEAAYNSFEQSSQFFNLETGDNFVETLLPNATGEVEEDRYEFIVTHGRTLADGLTLQLSAGGEKSELSQTGPGGLTRNFWRPKGSLSLAWTPREGLDLALNVSRKVGQLSFGDFLASVSLALGNENAGNVQLKPRLSWESNLQIKQNLGDWGSSTLQLFINDYDDYIDIIPIAGGGESRGNIDSARLYGVEWNSTFNLDPMGWEGLRLDIELKAENSSIEDPLTGMERAFSNHYNRTGDITLRHDIPGTDWAWGVGAQYYHVLPSYRLSQVQKDFEGPVYTQGFIEHKDFYGLTVNFQIFNLTDGRSIFQRTVYDGLRTEGNILFHENRDLSVQPIFRLQFTGNF